MIGKDMKLFEDMILKDSIEINAAPEQVFDFLLQLVDDASYRAWHPDDHVAFRWVKGNPWEDESIGYAEEYFHGKLHKFRFRVSKVVTNRWISYAPVSRLLRMFFPESSFDIKPNGKGCIFTGQVHLRIGKMAKTFAKHRLERGLTSVRKHMKEEGENLKRMLEGANSQDRLIERIS
jgi:hypothetical protein